MLSDLKGLHDMEENVKFLENRNNPSSKELSLAEKLKIARQEYLKIGTAKLNEAKQRLENILVKAVREGETSFTVATSLFDLGTAERIDFESWLLDNGIKWRRHSDQRDGDYYTLELRDKL